MSYVDGAIGSMVDALQTQHLADSTALIVSAKHGQSPIDPSKLHTIGDQVTNVLTAANVGVAQNTSDDVALVWLKNQRQTSQAIAALNADKHAANRALVDFLYTGDLLVDRFGDPRTNSRTPDLIVQPQAGTIYTTSGAKVAEHGGGTVDDTHVALLVVAPDQSAAHIGERVETRQIAPTILALLGLNPHALDSVRIEHTRTLPSVGD